uniref:Uncharacterized protein n=1 Tax=Rhizophora mucronata TaxID=61149 RepID=A0A2P2JMA3_RHIMU
MQQRNHQQR